MTNKQARKRYFAVFFPAMIGYVISCFGVDMIIDRMAGPSPAVYALALLPAFFVFLWVWSHARFVLEIDEFVRMLQIKSILAGLIVLMCVTTTWGFLEIYADVPALPIFYVLPGFYLFYGIAAFIIGRRNNVGCEML